MLSPVLVAEVACGDKEYHQYNLWIPSGNLEFVGAFSECLGAALWLQKYPLEKSTNVREACWLSTFAKIACNTEANISNTVLTACSWRRPARSSWRNGSV